MKTEHFELELLTRCFLGGANPREVAELRASSIRGQLRWWFRTLGGFAFFKQRIIRQQEGEIFGVAAGDTGQAGQLRLQVLRPAQPVVEIIGPQQVRDLPNEKYLLWPFEQQRQGEDNPRACLSAGTKFQLRVHWRGNQALWPSIQALVTVFGQLGSLGTRSRRAMGALGFVGSAPDLDKAMNYFAKPSSIIVRQINLTVHANREAAAATLAVWLKGWRQHGQQSCSWKWHDPKDHNKGGNWRNVNDSAAVASKGFVYARRDHNEGVKILTGNYPASNPKTPAGSDGTTFRPAIGLPIGQRFSSLGTDRGPWPSERNTVNWEFGTGANKGRFASPVILRPYRTAANQWRALVIFVDAHQWPDDPVTGTPKPVYLNGAPRAVSRYLYEEMKRQTLTPFPCVQKSA